MPMPPMIAFRAVACFLFLFSATLRCASSEEISSPQFDPGRLAVDDIIKPGNELSFDEHWDGVSLTEWRMVITKVEGNTFKGLARPVAGHRFPLGLPLGVWNQVDGALSTDGYRFTISEPMHDDDDFHTRQFECRSLAGRPAQFNFDGLRDSSIWEIKTLSSDQMDALIASNKTAVSSARQQWHGMKERVKRLQSKGHNLLPFGFLENGRVDLFWDETKSVEGKKDGYWPNLDVMKDLKEFEYIHTVMIHQDFDPHELTSLKCLKHIGSLKFFYFRGDQISRLSGGPRIDALWIISVTPQSLMEISRLKSIRSLTINNQNTYRAFRTSDGLEPLRHLSNLPNLIEFELISPLNDNQGGIDLLKGASKLRRLVYPGSIGKRDLEALASFPELKYALIGSLDPHLISEIKHDGLERLGITFSWKANASHLENWDLGSIKRLQLPFWLPQQAMVYLRRLPTMDPAERSCYTALNLVEGLWDDSRRARAIEDQLSFYGGMLYTDVAEQERSRVLGFIHEPLMELKNSQVSARKAIPLLAKRIQARAAELAGKEIMPLENAIAVQSKTFRFSGELETSLATYFSDDDRKSLDRKRQDYLRKSR